MSMPLGWKGGGGESTPPLPLETKGESWVLVGMEPVSSGLDVKGEAKFFEGNMEEVKDCCDG